MDVSGSHVVVTGAASGIGAAMARRFGVAGARNVTLADVQEDAATAVVDAIKAAGGSADVQRCDVSRERDIARLVDESEARHGPIDLFCSNAGILGGIGGADLPDDEWRSVIDVNVMAHIWAARHLVPRMTARGSGYLLHTASAAGLLTQIGAAPYSVTKHAAVAFAEWLAITHGDAGLKVSVLCPQAVNTAMTAGTDEGGVAGVDGMLEPDAVAEVVIAGLAAERFLILPHPEVAEYVRRKADDHDRWIAGMRRLQARYV